MRRNYQKAKPKAIIKLFKSNEQILSPQVFLINEEGEHLGITETREAIRLAREASLDLVEVNPKANPPVAKIRTRKEIAQAKGYAEKD
jgi:translation initiation factor IF-3